MPAILAEIKGRIPSSYQLHKRSFQFGAFFKSMHIAFLSCSKHTVLAFQTVSIPICIYRRRRMHELIESRTKRTALEFDSPRRELWLSSPERATKPVLPVTFQKSFILVLRRLLIDYSPGGDSASPMCCGVQNGNVYHDSQNELKEYFVRFQPAF